MSWSPDGSEFLFVAGGVYVVSTDGSGLRRLLDQPRVWWEMWLNPVISNHTGRTLAAWSPDGSRIAVYYPEDIAPLDHRDSGGQLFTIARDGTDLRILVGPDKELGVEVDEDVGIQAWNPPRKVRLLDLGPCRAGVAAGDTEADPGLVRDCETLVVVMNALGGRAGASWDASKLDLARRVLPDGTPPRIRVLNYKTATGVLTPELGRLTELRKLDLSNDVEHRISQVSGDIPRELGDLAKLEVLNLQEIYLSGRIPAELGNLGNLRVLFLGGNDLSGPIPGELGALKNLGELSLNDNNLNGGIPPELGGLTVLESLDLSNNLLTGSIPPELGGLTGLESLDLSNNRLTGSIPPELGALESLTALNLAGNDFWGCIAAGWAEIWVRQSGLAALRAGRRSRPMSARRRVAASVGPRGACAAPGSGVRMWLQRQEEPMVERPNAQSRLRRGPQMAHRLHPHEPLGQERSARQGIRTSAARTDSCASSSTPVSMDGAIVKVHPDLPGSIMDYPPPSGPRLFASPLRSRGHLRQGSVDRLTLATRGSVRTRHEDQRDCWFWPSVWAYRRVKRRMGLVPLLHLGTQVLSLRITWR